MVRILLLLIRHLAAGSILTGVFKWECHEKHVHDFPTLAMRPDLIALGAFYISIMLLKGKIFILRTGQILEVLTHIVLIGAPLVVAYFFTPEDVTFWDVVIDYIIQVIIPLIVVFYIYKLEPNN